MIFYSITNIPAFFRCVNNCRGDVAFIDERGEMQDLKPIARQGAALGGLIQTGQLGRIEVRASALEDRQRLMRFMQEMRAV